MTRKDEEERVRRRNKTYVLRRNKIKAQTDADLRSRQRHRTRVEPWWARTRLLVSPPSMPIGCCVPKIIERPMIAQGWRCVLAGLCRSLTCHSLPPDVFSSVPVLQGIKVCIRGTWTCWEIPRPIRCKRRFTRSLDSVPYGPRPWATGWKFGTKPSWPNPGTPESALRPGHGFGNHCNAKSMWFYDKVIQGLGIRPIRTDPLRDASFTEVDGGSLLSAQICG